MMPKLQKRLASLDTETTGVDFHHGAKPFLVTMTIDSGGASPDTIYWEWDVDPFTREPQIPARDIKEIRKEISAADELILQNPRFDVRALSIIGIDDFPWHKVQDTLIAGHLLASNQPHDLTTMALVYLGVNIKPFEEAMDEAVDEARRLCRRKGFIEEHGQWLIAKEGLPCMPSAKNKTGKFDMWLPRTVARLCNLPDDHPWHTVCSEYANADSMVTLPLFRKMKQEMANR